MDGETFCIYSAVIRVRAPQSWADDQSMQVVMDIDHVAGQHLDSLRDRLKKIDPNLEVELL